jgi:hypothetical protein
VDTEPEQNGSNEKDVEEAPKEAKEASNWVPISSLSSSSSTLWTSIFVVLIIFEKYLSD